MKSITKIIIKSISLVVLLITGFNLAAQEEESEDSPLEISGSVDLYYKYDFSGYSTPENASNRPTWFAENQNSISIGMVDIALSKTTGKTTFYGEVAFGPRGDGSASENNSATAPGSIQNLYASYEVSDRLSLTGGFMATFVGYEVISPVTNFNYSASYLFSNGPFQNAGFKADYAIDDDLALMVGVFSSTWDSYTADPSLGMDNLGLQLRYTPIEEWDVYLNLISGSQYNQWDVTTGYQVSDPLYLGLNVSQNGEYGGNEEGGFFGFAGYVQYAITDATTLGMRYENYAPEATGSAAYNSFTFSANIQSGKLTFIPEIRLDTSDKKMFYSKNDLSAVDTDSFRELILAAVYSF